MRFDRILIVVGFWCLGSCYGAWIGDSVLKVVGAGAVASLGPLFVLRCFPALGREVKK